MTVHRIALPYSVPPLHANQRLNRHARARKTAQVRRDAGWIVKAAKVGPQPRVVVGLEWRPKVRRRRDGGENLAPLLKTLIDGGLVDAGIVPDDTPELVATRGRRGRARHVAGRGDAVTATQAQVLWAQLCRLAARRNRRADILREHAGVEYGADLPRCVPRRPDGLKDKIIYPDEAAARACCAALRAELGEQQWPYPCKRRRARHWHLTSQRTKHG